VYVEVGRKASIIAELTVTSLCFSYMIIRHIHKHSHVFFLLHRSVASHLIYPCWLSQAGYSHPGTWHSFNFNQVQLTEVFTCAIQRHDRPHTWKRTSQLSASVGWNWLLYCLQFSELGGCVGRLMQPLLRSFVLEHLKMQLKVEVRRHLAKNFH